LSQWPSYDQATPSSIPEIAAAKNPDDDAVPQADTVTASDHGKTSSAQSFLVRSNFNTRPLAAPQHIAVECHEETSASNSPFRTFPYNLDRVRLS
jgi:hypothetical protein